MRLTSCPAHGVRQPGFFDFVFGRIDDYSAGAFATETIRVTCAPRSTSALCTRGVAIVVREAENTAHFVTVNGRHRGPPSFRRIY